MNISLGNEESNLKLQAEMVILCEGYLNRKFQHDRFLQIYVVLLYNEGIAHKRGYQWRILLIT